MVVSDIKWIFAGQGRISRLLLSAKLLLRLILHLGRGALTAHHWREAGTWHVHALTAHGRWSLLRLLGHHVHKAAHAAIIRIRILRLVHVRRLVGAATEVQAFREVGSEQGERIVAVIGSCGWWGVVGWLGGRRLGRALLLLLWTLI